MKKNILVVFPTKKQIEYIQEYYPGYKYYVISHNKFEDNAMFVYISEDKKLNIPDDVKVLCCHEEGIYWLKCNIKKSWELQFSNKLFSIILKNNFKEYLSSIGVKNTLFWENENKIEEYPIVIKPIIGFGSIGVKKINNEMELKKVVEGNDLEKFLSSIAPYKNKYFPSETNRFIFEKYISGKFFRVPFVMEYGQIKYIFPIKGNETTYKKNSDFHWTEFELGKVDNTVIEEMKKILTELTCKLRMTEGVFVAEFIVDNKDNVFLLEMSPRQTSSRICKMVEYYSGIDLELLAIDLFFLKKNVSLCNRKRNIIMQIFRNKINLHSDCMLLEKIEEVSVYGDKIVTVYSERKDE